MDTNGDRRTVLIAPLDWGLGHTTRCIPLIHFFLEKGWKVIVGCEYGSASFALLRKEVPDISYINVPGYHIRYAHAKRWFSLKIVLQIPRILYSIHRENRILARFIAQNPVNLVISDNRYGWYHPQIPCLFITHQLQIMAPGEKTRQWLQTINYRYIRYFTACWVPDYPAAPGIGGQLSHPARKPLIPVQYIGPLCRLGEPQTADPQFVFLALLSGPEPQRTLLEKKLLEVSARLPVKVLLVRGLPQANGRPSVPDNCTVVNHLDTEGMRRAFAVSQYILCRSGYTSVMEILLWNKKSILIPTPGQTEQEYLGRHLMEEKLAYCFPQDEKDWLKAIQQALSFPYRPVHTMSGKSTGQLLEEALQQLHI